MGLSPSTNNPQGLADRIGKDSKLEVPASTQFVEKGSSFEVDEKGKGEREREGYDNAMRTKRGGDESL